MGYPPMAKRSQPSILSAPFRGALTDRILRLISLKWAGVFTGRLLREARMGWERCIRSLRRNQI